MMKCILILLMLSNLSSFAANAESQAITVGALDLLAKGKIEGAEQLFYRALMLDSQNGVALHEVGKILLKKGEKSSSADFFTRAEIALKEDATQTVRYRDLVSVMKSNFPQAAQMKDALEEYRATVEKVVNANNNELIRGVASEKLKPLGLEIKIVTRDQTLAAYAVVELKQNLLAPVGTLVENASRLSLQNFAQPYTNVPGQMEGLQFNQIRYGEGQHPFLTALQGGKILVSCTEEAAKTLKAEKKYELRCGNDVYPIYLMTVAPKQAIAFKEQVVVFAAEVTIKTKK